MKRVLFYFLCLMVMGLFAPICGFAGEEEEAEDYQILREIIRTEFSGQDPHEWGEAVSGVKTRLKTDDKVLAIGIDACDLMGEGEDARLIKFFMAENIPATLFLCGEWIEKNGTVLKKLASNPLFEIANQGISRKACSVTGKDAQGAAGTRDAEDLFAEVERNARKIESMTGILPQYYHAGAGYYDEVAVRVIRALGYEAIGSSVTRFRGESLSKRDVLDALMNPSAGAIAVLGGSSLSASFTDGVIEAVKSLRSRGYRFVKFSDYPLE